MYVPRGGRCTPLYALTVVPYCYTKSNVWMALMFEVCILILGVAFLIIFFVYISAVKCGVQSR